MQQCTLCKEFKQIQEFSRNWKMVSGHLWQCKKCCKERHKSYTKKYNSKLKPLGLSIATVQRYGFETALKVYERDKRQCQICFESNDLTIHHKDGQGRHNKEKGLFVNNDIENLIVLCRKCHGGIHSKQGGGRPRKE